MKVEPVANGPRVNKLVAFPTTGASFELLPIAETTFVRSGSSLKYEFMKDTASAATFNAVRITGRTDRLTRHVSPPMN